MFRLDRDVFTMSKPLAGVNSPAIPFRYVESEMRAVSTSAARPASSCAASRSGAAASSAAARSRDDVRTVTDPREQLEIVGTAGAGGIDDAPANERDGEISASGPARRCRRPCEAERERLAIRSLSARQ